MNNLRCKVSLLMKFGQFMSYSKGNNFIKKFYKNCSLKTISNHSLYWKINFLKSSTYIIYVIAKLIKISPNQHAGLLSQKELSKLTKKVFPCLTSALF